MTKVWVKGYDEVVQLLEAYRAADKRLDRLAGDLQSIQIRQTQQFSNEPKGGASDVPELQRYIEHKESVCEKIQTQIESIGDQFDKVIQMVNCLRGAQYEVIVRYYIYGKPMRAVSESMNYAVRQCWNYRDDAICEMAKKMYPLVSVVCKDGMIYTV